MDPESFAKPSSPLSSKSRAVIAFHAKHGYFPDGDRDKIRYLDNMNLMIHDLESRIPLVTDLDLPVFVRDETSRAEVVNDWIDGNRETEDRGNVSVFSNSIACKSTRGKLQGIIEDAISPWIGECHGGYWICKKTADEEIGSGDHGVKQIPGCVSRFKNATSLYLKNTSIDKIENLDELIGLKKIQLENTGITRIENLDKNVNLLELSLRNTGVSKIENLENNTKLRVLNLYNTKVKRIENLERNAKLRVLNLRGTGVKEIENLDENTNLKVLNLKNTSIPRNECTAFEESRPGLKVVC